MTAIAIVISEILTMIDEALVYIGEALTFSIESTKTERDGD